MRIITANLNGIRAASRKGFFQWLARQRADFVCIQETKAQIHQINDAITHPKSFYVYYNDAVKKGYSGVGIYSKHKPDTIVETLGWSVADDEGRYLQVDIGKLTIISLYLPSGSSGDERQAVKYDFLDRFYEHMKQLNTRGRKVIICGDWNIVHKAIDIKNWKSNQKNSGCLPEERAWLDKVFDKLGYVDAFRVVNDKPDQYTWWSNRGRARENNVGWRIDYQIVTPNVKPLVQSAKIYKEKWFSDHAPLIMDYDVGL